MAVNDKLTKRDTALGGKIWCEGCGGAWWLSGPQAAAFHESGKWPHKCGNNPGVPGTGSGDHCTDVTEMRFEPYDVAENVSKLKAAAGAATAAGDDAAAEHYHKAASELPENAARIRKEVAS